MVTVRMLVESLGGGAAVAADFGIDPSAVSQWISSDRIPPARLLPLWQLARRRGVAWTPPGAEGLSAAPVEES